MARAARSSRGAEAQERAVKLMLGQPPVGSPVSTSISDGNLTCRATRHAFWDLTARLHSVPSITEGGESATRSVLTRPARDVYTVNQSDLRVSIWSEAGCGLAVGILGEILQAWKAVAGCQPHEWQHRVRVSQWTGTTTRT